VEEKKNDLCERLFEFAVAVIEFLKTLPYSPENKTIRTQLSKSACSSGANYEEAQSGSSKADFTNKVRISLREMRESNYWLRIIKRTVKEVNPYFCLVTFVFLLLSFVLPHTCDFCLLSYPILVTFVFCLD